MPFYGLADRVAEVRERVAAATVRGGHGQAVRIVAVTKALGPDAVEAAWKAGIGDIGENKVQEAVRKMAAVSAPVVWHLIGHLQRNKVRDCDRFELIHSLDSARLADALSRMGEERGRPVDVLLQLNASHEDSKSGYAESDVPVAAEQLRALRGVRVRGTMTMAELGADERELRATFAAARDARAVLAAAGHPATEISMGMSQDYEIAVEEGATIVRLGAMLFGERPIQQVGVTG